MVELLCCFIVVASMKLVDLLNIIFCSLSSEFWTIQGILIGQ
jgi:hypothetical protein